MKNFYENFHEKVPILITVTKLSVEDKILSFSFEPLNALSIKLRALKKMPSLGVLQQNHNLMDSLRFCENLEYRKKITETMIFPILEF
jgi:ABC-type lipoprotein export system ATPase subunit